MDYNSTLEILWTFTHNFPTVSINWGRIGLVSLDEKGYVYIWLDTGSYLKDKLGVNFAAVDVKLSPSGGYIAVGGDRVVVLTPSGNKIFSFKNESFTNKIVWFPDGKKILAIQNKGVAVLKIFGDGVEGKCLRFNVPFDFSGWKLRYIRRKRKEGLSVGYEEKSCF